MLIIKFLPLGFWKVSSDFTSEIKENVDNCDVGFEINLCYEIVSRKFEVILLSYAQAGLNKFLGVSCKSFRLNYINESGRYSKDLPDCSHNKKRKRKLQKLLESVRLFNVII